MCRALEPELEKVARVKAGGAVVAELNVEAMPEIAARFGVTSLPTLILFAGGRESTRLSGAVQAGVLMTAIDACKA
jgi:thioredoxin-like negative regulator of GroEL